MVKVNKTREPTWRKCPICRRTIVGVWERHKRSFLRFNCPYCGQSWQEHPLGTPSTTKIRRKENNELLDGPFGGRKWWWSVRFFARNRPGEVGTTTQINWYAPVEIRTRRQWNRWRARFEKWLEQNKKTGDTEAIESNPLSKKFIQNYITTFKKDYPGAYSMGPFETKKLAIQAVYDTDEDWKRIAADWWEYLSPPMKKRDRVIDLTDWRIYEDADQAAKAVQGHRAGVHAVCKGQKKSYKDHVFRYEDPGEPGRPFYGSEERWLELKAGGIKKDVLEGELISLDALEEY